MDYLRRTISESHVGTWPDTHSVKFANPITSQNLKYFHLQNGADGAGAFFD